MSEHQPAGPDGTDVPAGPAAVIPLRPPVAEPGPGAAPEPAAEARPAAGRPGPTLSETTLVARAQDGDLDAFEQIVRQYQQPLFRLAYRMLFDRAEAEDAVQDSLVLAWRKLATLSDPQAFPAWIYNVTTRRCLNIIRSRERARTELGIEGDLTATVAELRPTAPADDPVTTAEFRDLQRGLDAALRDLPADLRVCWVLNELHDLSYPEIADVLGVQVSTVRGRLARARLKLAKGMASWQ